MTYVFSILTLITVCAFATGCVTPMNRYEALDSAAQMRPNVAKGKGHEPYTYEAPNTDWGRYMLVSIDPVVVYGGADQQFGKTSELDRQELAAYMQERFSEALQEKYTLTTANARNALRVHLTLTGAETNVPVLSTVGKIAPVGALIHTVQTAADKPDFVSGSVSYAIEVYDVSSGRLIRAYESRQYPAAENVKASWGALAAAKTGIDKGAAALLDELK